MQLINDVILPRMGQENTVFVFPSEVTARLLQRQALAEGGYEACRNNRFISWDQFKEQTVAVTPDKTPANNYIRILFAQHICARNKDRPLFKSIIGTEFSGNSTAYINYLAGLLPVLHRFDLLKKDNSEIIDTTRRSDLETLYTQYQRFLNANRLYEPNYENPVLQSGTTGYIVFFPEVIRDFEAIDPTADRDLTITTVNTESILSGRQAELVVYKNTIREVKHTLHTICGLLDRGVDPADIVITAAGLERIESCIKEQAAILQLELDFHQGKPLGTYPGVNFLSRIREVYRSGFSVREISALIRNRTLPWKQREQAEGLIRFGTSFYCIQNYRISGRETDLWQDGFRRLTRSKDYSSQDLQNLAAFYNRLKTHIHAVNNAPSFIRLKAAVQDFCVTFFDPLFFLDEAYGYLEFSLKILQELIDNSEKINLPDPVSCFPLWLEVLAGRKYVRQGPKRGIAVYPYRVSAGIQPAYHFIINASQANTNYIIPEFPFLHIDEESALEEHDLDLSNPMLALYLCSGRNISISYAKKDFSDSHLPPGFFITAGTIKEFDDEAGPAFPDPLEQELCLWRGKRSGKMEKKKPAGRGSETIEEKPGIDRPAGRGSETAGADRWVGPLTGPPQQLLPLQKQGFARACRTVLIPKADDFLSSPVRNSSLIPELVGKLPHEQGKLRISPTSLELFWGCSFSFLLSQILELEPELYEPNLLDSLWLGNVIHRVFEFFFRELEKDHADFSTDKVPYYTQTMRNSLDLLERYFFTSEAIPIAPVWEYTKRELYRHFTRFLAIEAETYPGYRIYGLEQTLELDWENPALALRGKIDRISVKNDEYVIIDYKKKSTPSVRDLLVNDETLSRFQIPFYFYLLGGQGLRVTAASYYSFEKGRYVHVLKADDPHALAGPADIDRMIEVMKQRITQMASRLKHGDYSLHPEEADISCRNCMFRAVCRLKYVCG